MTWEPAAPTRSPLLSHLILPPTLAWVETKMINAYRMVETNFYGADPEFQVKTKAIRD